MSDAIINRVAESPLISIDLDDFYSESSVVTLDLKDQLFQGLILREKDFRNFVKEHDWEAYQNKYVGVHCSADAVIPHWAYMLVASRIVPFCKDLFYGDHDAVLQKLVAKKIEQMDTKDYRDRKVVIKGCGNFSHAEELYLKITQKLSPVVSSLMFGEPCSTVPIYKRKK